MKHLVYSFTVFLLLFAGTASAQERQSNKVSDPAALGEVYFEVVGVSDPTFPSWTALKGHITFDDYVVQVRNWIIAHPSQFYSLLQNHTSSPRLNTFDMLSMDAEKAANLKMIFKDWSTLIRLQTDNNRSYDFIQALEKEYSKINNVRVFMYLVHVDDLNNFYINI